MLIQKTPTFVFISILALLILGAPFTMIEGDDAATLMFHLANYNFDKYQPYSTYHVGYDVFLYFVNLIVGVYKFKVAVLILNIVIVVLNIFLLVNVFNKLLCFHFNYYWLVPFIFVVSPEWIFSSWVIGAPNLALSFSLLGLKIYLNKTSKWYIASMCFALACAIRFDFVFTLILLPFFQAIAEDRYIPEVKKNGKMFKTILFSILAGIILIVFFLYFIHIKDDKVSNLKDVLKLISDVFNLKLEWVGKASNSNSGLTSSIGALTFFTPTFVLVSILGIMGLLFEDHKVKQLKIWIFWFIIILVSAYIFGWYYTFAGTIKRTLFLIPFIMFLFFKGVEFFISRNMKSLFVVLISFLILQSVVAVKVETNKSSYGPDLSLKNFHKISNSKDKQLVTVGLGSGFAYPTEEGVRPVLGFAKSIIDWSLLYSNKTIWYKTVLLDTDFITFIDMRSRIFDEILFQEGFFLTDVKKLQIGDLSLEMHHFRNVHNKIKILASSEGGSIIWRKNLTKENLFMLSEYFDSNMKKSLNCAWSYSSNQYHFLNDKRIIMLSPFTIVM